MARTRTVNAKIKLGLAAAKEAGLIKDWVDNLNGRWTIVTNGAVWHIGDSEAQAFLAELGPTAPPELPPRTRTRKSR